MYFIRRLLAALLALAASVSGTASADGYPERWRQEVAAARQLAENDAPQAFREASRLQAAMPVGATPADQALILNLRARAELYLALTEPAAVDAENALSVAGADGDKVGLAEAHLNIALIALNQGRIAANGKASASALTVLDGVQRPDLLGEAMLHTAMGYLRNGQLDSSVTLAMQALDMAQHTGDPLALAYAFQGMGIAMEQSGRYEKSGEYYNRMREQARAAGSKRLEAHALLGMAVIASAQEQYRAAESNAREATAMFRSIGTPFSVGHALFTLADILRRQDRRKEALAILDEVVETYERNPNKIGLWWTLNTRSADRLALGQTAPAAADAERAYALAKDIGAPLYLSSSARQLAALAAAGGNYRLAYTLSAEAAETAARGEKERAGQQIDKLAERFQSEARQRQIEELTRQAQHHALEQRWLWTVLAASMLLLAITGGFLLRQRRSNRLLAELNFRVQHTSRKLQATLDALPDLLFEVGLDGRIHDYHSPRTELLAMPPEQFLGRIMQDVLPPEAGEVCAEALREANASGASTGRQFALSLPQGTAWFELSIARKAEVPGRKPHFVMLARDITRRKQAEHEIRLLQRAINQSSDGMFVKNLSTGRFVSVNDAACRSLGYSREELLGMTVLDIDPDITAEALAQAHQSLEFGKPHMLETRHRSKDGHIFPVEITGAFFEDNGVPYAISLVRNIAARKRIENTLRFIANPTGERNFLAALARHLGENLGAPYVIIAKLADETGIAETVVFYADGDILPNLRYTLADTPCHNVAGKRACCHPSSVQALFPKDALLADMGVESYAGVPLWDSTGQPIGLIAIMDGVPMTDEAAVMQLLQIVAPRAAAELERARSDARLQASEQAFRALVENSPDNIARYDRDCRRVYANPQILKLFGRPAETVLGKTPDGASPLLDVPRYIGLLRHVLETGDEITDELAFRTAGGELRWAHMRFVPEYGADGTVASVLAIGRDVSELKESERRFRTLAENSPNLIVRYDRECRRVYVNPAFERETQLAREQALGTLPHGDSRLDVSVPADDYANSLRAVMATGIRAEMQISWTKRGSGEIVHHAVNIVPEYDQLGNAVGALTIGHDITALKLTEARLRESYSLLQELTSRRETAREEERKRIAREIHDELGQHLTALKLKVNLLNFQFGSAAPTLRDAVGGVLDLVDRTIQVARNVSTSLRPAALDMGIVTALDWLASEFERNTGIACELGPMPADPRLSEEQSVVLFRIAQESLTNVARHAKAGRVRITLAQENDCHVLEITDDGQGFDPSALRHQKFGLVGVRERVLAVGGDAEIHSAPGRGTRIRATIPIQEFGDLS